MKKIFISVLVICLLLFIGYLLKPFTKNFKVVKNNLTVIENVTEVDSRYLVLSDTSIVFSVNSDSLYQLMKYKNRSIEKLTNVQQSIFSPFQIQKIIAGLSDFNGDENYKIVPNFVNKYLGGNYVKKIFSFNMGNYLILRLQNSSRVSFINLNNDKKVELFEFKNKLNGVSYSKKNNCFIISYDDVLLCYDVENNNTHNLAVNMKGEKLNPFIFNEQLFFVNNFYSEYYQIYTLNMNDKNITPKIFYKTEHDVKLPKYNGKYLYFVEVINSEYLLKRKNMKNNLVETITNKGVVYNYSLYDSNKLVFTYSDFFTPRCLAIYNLADKLMKNISGSSINISSNYKFYDRSEDLSSAYEFYPTQNKKFKGVVLFFHPGLHSDFSPRWDSVLMTLVENGYKVFAPNYPMSFGYGKSYALSDFEYAVNDMAGWKKYLKEKYKNKPLYFMSASSGNILMEKVLEITDEDVNASVSLFGLSRIKPQNKTLYILGKNDPLIDYDFRYNQLREHQTAISKLSIETYNKEGHWFRSKGNIKDAVEKILYHFNTEMNN